MSEPTYFVGDHGYVKFIESWGNGTSRVPEAGIIEAARQSTSSAFTQWDDMTCAECIQNPDFNCPLCHGLIHKRGDRRLLKFLLLSKPQHSSPFEFAGTTIEDQAPIFIAREWQRHRTQPYNELSGRYTTLPHQDYHIEWELLVKRATTHTTNKQQNSIAPFDEEKARQWLEQTKKLSEEIEHIYQLGLQAGIPKEIARMYIPLARYTRMRVSATLRILKRAFPNPTKLFLEDLYNSDGYRILEPCEFSQEDDD